MGLYEARDGYCAPAFVGEIDVSDKELYQKTLSAVKQRRGLIHGSMIEGKKVCALGAVGAKYGHIVCKKSTAEAIQEFNDSMPDATPAERRTKVIEWLQARLADLEADAPKEVAA